MWTTFFPSQIFIWKQVSLHLGCFRIKIMHINMKGTIIGELLWRALLFIISIIKQLFEEITWFPAHGFTYVWVSHDDLTKISNNGYQPVLEVNGKIFIKQKYKQYTLYTRQNTLRQNIIQSTLYTVARHSTKIGAVLSTLDKKYLQYYRVVLIHNLRKRWMHVTEKYCGHHCSVIIYTKMLEDNGYIFQRYFMGT